MLHSRYHTTSSRARRILRALGLGLSYEVWQKLRNGETRSFETRKIAIRKDRLVAALTGLIHFIPVTVSLALCILNSVGYYIGSELAGPSGQDDEKFAGLQMAAKLHELTIQASVAAILIHHIRHELIFSGGLPFGALFAGQQFKDISYIWSSEFWGLANGTFASRKHRWRLIFFVVVCTLLGVTAGPSSATILKPRMGNWAAGGTDFWIDVPSNDTWPTSPSMADVDPDCGFYSGDKSCPSGDWELLAEGYFSYWKESVTQGYLPSTVRIPGLNSIRELYPQMRSKSWQFSKNFTVATTQDSIVADAVAETGRLWAWVVAAAWQTKGQPWRFWSHVDATYTVYTHQPIVHTRCLLLNDSVRTNLSSGNVPFYDLSDIASFQESGDFARFDANQTALLDQINETTEVINETQLRWLKVIQPYMGRPAIGVLVSLPKILNKQPAYYTCTFDVRTAPTRVQSKRNALKIVTSHVDGSTTWDPPGNQGTYASKNSWPSIAVDPEWAVYLNPKIAARNSTVFREILFESGILSSGDLSAIDQLFAIESVLSVMLANGLARQRYGRQILGKLKDWNFDPHATCGSWCDQMMPANGRHMGDGGSVFWLNGTQRSSSSRLRMHAQAEGYAYSPEGLTTKLAIAVLLLYCVLALGHWAYLCLAGESSTSWDTTSEVVALAMNSRQADALYNTGAGIETLKVFRDNVRIVSAGERVELSFSEEPDQERLAPNAWYS